VALAPLASTPVLRLAAQGLAAFAPDLLLGALFAVGLLFGFPAILLGTATPWALRLAAQSPNLQFPISRLGQTAGRLSAVATTGSLIGAFLPVLWLIPAFGTRWTFYLLALTLLAAVSISAWRQPHRWAPLAASGLVLAMAFLIQPPGVRAAWDDGRAGALIYEDESAFNYIAVRQWGSERHLKLNDGIGIHSVDHPDALLSQGIWDYFLLAPLFRQSPISNLLLIGAAAGTVPGLYTEIYGSIPITGVELDPQIIAVGQQLFDCELAELHGGGGGWAALAGAAARRRPLRRDRHRRLPPALHSLSPDNGGVLPACGRAPERRWRRRHQRGAHRRQRCAGRSNGRHAAASLSRCFHHRRAGAAGDARQFIGGGNAAAHVTGALSGQRRAVARHFPRRIPGICARTAADYARPATPPSSAPIFTDDHSQVEQVVHGLIMDFMFGKWRRAVSYT
jgi:hypothetical protein